MLFDKAGYFEGWVPDYQWHNKKRTIFLAIGLRRNNISLIFAVRYERCGA